MALTLLFLGRLEDVAGSASRVLACERALSLAEIVERLEPDLAVALAAPEIRVALDGELVAPAALRAGDDAEVAFLPPVSGG